MDGSTSNSIAPVAPAAEPEKGTSGCGGKGSFMTGQNRWLFIAAAVLAVAGLAVGSSILGFTAMLPLLFILPCLLMCMKGHGKGGTPAAPMRRNSKRASHHKGERELHNGTRRQQMTKTMKMLVMGVVGAVGLTSAAVAQQSTQQNTAQRQGMTPEQHRQMMSGGNMGQGHMNMMMNDPQMRKQMTDMMANCNRMMQMMGNMSGTNTRPNN